ncbi:MAG: hypothetical protein AAFR67_09560, partial [Chloroflexota bacterium]
MIIVKHPKLYKSWYEQTREQLDWVIMLVFDILKISQNLPIHVRNHQLEEAYLRIHNQIKAKTNDNSLNDLMNLHHNAY